MGKIEPIKGHFESAKAFLHHIAEDEKLEGFVLISVRKGGEFGRAHFEMSKANMALASVLLSHWAVEQ